MIEAITVRNIGPHQSASIGFNHGGNVVIGPSDFGKSYLIVDALFFALYGRHRGDDGDKARPDKLAYLDKQTGQQAQEMMASVIWSQMGIRYEITRRRNVGKKTVLTAVDLTTGQPLAGEGASVSDTQAAIERLIGLTFQQFSFICYIDQKRALKWSTASSSERERIVREFLDLQRYSRWGKSAGSLVWQSEQELRTLNERLTEFLTGAETIPQLESSLKAFTADSQAAQRNLTANAKQVAKLQAELDREQESENQHAATAEKLRQVTADITAITARIATAESSLAVDTALAGRRAEFEADVARLRELTAEKERMEARQKQLNELSGRVGTLGLKLAGLQKQKATADQTAADEFRLTATARIEAGRLHNAGNIGDLPKRIAAIETETSPLQGLRDKTHELNQRIEAERATLTKLQQERSQKEASRQALLTQKETLLAQAERAKANLDTAPCSSNAALRDACPYLSDAREAAARIDTLREEIQLGQRPIYNSAEGIAEETIAALTTEREQVIAQGKALAAKEAELTALRRDLTAKQEMAAAHAKAQADAELHTSRRDAAIRESNGYIQQITETESERSELSGALDELSRIALQLTENAAALDAFGFSDPSADLAGAIAAEARIPQHNTAIARDREQLTKLHTESTRLQSELAAYSSERLAACKAELEQATAKQAELQTEQDRIFADRNSVEARLITARTADRKAGETKTAITEAEAKLNARKGLQAVYAQAPKIIIENMFIPSFESACARIYAQIMGGTLRLRTQREQKSSDRLAEVFEAMANGLTLDMLGGTASMAAELAQILALQESLLGPNRGFLIFDEGNLGQMDAPHLTRSKQVLRQLASWMPQVILVTHLEDMKDTYASVIDFNNGAAELMDAAQEEAA